MNTIALSNTPNQKLSVSIAGRAYTIRTHYAPDGICFVDIYADWEPLALGVKAIPNSRLIPYDYQLQGGNFFFVCEDGAYPDWELFGWTHNLVWFDTAEIEEIGL